MCLLESLPPADIFTTNALLDLPEMDHPSSSASAEGNHFERLLATATIVSLMGIGQPEISSPTRLNNQPGSPSSSVASSLSPSSSQRQRGNGLQQLCAMVTFLLGAPMPPTPGIIPLCWEELVDWTEEATSLAASIAVALGSGRKKEEEGKPTRRVLFPNHAMNHKHGHGKIQFVPYVAVDETEDTLKTLASRTYMERAKFYQESVIIAVHQIKVDSTTAEGETKNDLLCLISPFQFCRYFTLLRRLHDSLTTLQAYDPTTTKVQHPCTVPFVEEEPLWHGDDDEEGECPSDDPLSMPPPSALRFLETRSEDEEGGGEKWNNTIIPEECSICMDKPEHSVLNCCSHGLCQDCEKRWVRKKLHCPFCRKSFRNVRDAVQTQWQLNVSAVPILKHVQHDIECLEHKIGQFWKSIIPLEDNNNEGKGGRNKTEMASILAQNYVNRPKAIYQGNLCCPITGGDNDANNGDFVVIVQQ